MNTLALFPDASAELLLPKRSLTQSRKALRVAKGFFASLRLCVRKIFSPLAVHVAIIQDQMKEATKRSILRLIHIVLAIPIVGYVYSPFQELPNYAPVVRFVSIPVLVLTGFWMWKGHAVRRLISKIGKK